MGRLGHIGPGWDRPATAYDLSERSALRAFRSAFLRRADARSRLSQELGSGFRRRSIARTLNITVLAEGIETEEVLLVLKAAGIPLFQGYWFARPTFKALPSVGSASTQTMRLTA